MRNRSILAAACGVVAVLHTASTSEAADFGFGDPAASTVPVPSARPTIKVVGALATDDFDEGISTTDHGLHAFGRVEAAYDVFYGALTGFTEGSDPNLGIGLTVGVRPSLGQVAFDVSLTREQVFGNPDESDTVFHGHATAPLSDTVSATAGATYELADEGRDTFDLYAEGTLLFPEAVQLGGKVTYQPTSEVSSDSAFKVGASIAVPLPKGFTVSSGLTYNHYTEDAVPNYAWYDIGASWQATDWATLDLRWHGNTLSDGDCRVHSANDCGGRLVGKVILTNEFGM